MTSKAEKQQAIDSLRSMISAGDTVYTVIRHVARSGMSRSIDMFVMSDGQPFNISYLVARASDRSIDQKNGGIKIGGCGMDMGFSLVYSLSHLLFPDGFQCVGRDGSRFCPSNDHSNGDRDYTPHMHTSGGYAINQRWM